MPTSDQLKIAGKDFAKLYFEKLREHEGDFVNKATQKEGEQTFIVLSYPKKYSPKIDGFLIMNFGIKKTRERKVLYSAKPHSNG